MRDEGRDHAASADFRASRGTLRAAGRIGVCGLARPRRAEAEATRAASPGRRRPVGGRDAAAAIAPRDSYSSSFGVLPRLALTRTLIALSGLI